jgi:hypothetical protein
MFVTVVAMIVMVAMTSTMTIVSAQTEQWGGCVIPGENPVVVKNQPTTVCLVVSSGDDWGTIQIPYQRWVWTPTVDEFSVFTIPNSYQTFVQEQNLMLPYVSVHAQSNATLSFVRRWYDADAGRELIFPYLTMIIDVYMGTIRGIAWDDGCVFCSKNLGSRCMEDTFNFNATAALQNNDTYSLGIREPTKGCWLRKSECDKAFNSTTGTNANPLCDLKVYATWTGTDKDGKVLTSSDNRFSAFPTDQVQRTVTALYQGAADTVDDVTNVVNDVSNTVQGNGEGAVGG